MIGGIEIQLIESCMEKCQRLTDTDIKKAYNELGVQQVLL